MIQGFLEKHLILDLWQEINKVNLEHLAVLDSKEMFKSLKCGVYLAILIYQIDYEKRK